MLAEGYLRSGKVRDLYRIDDGRLLLVASDRISAFDVILPTTVPDKGRVLTGVSRFWFGETADIVPNHLVGTDPGPAVGYSRHGQAPDPPARPYAAREAHRRHGDRRGTERLAQAGADRGN